MKKTFLAIWLLVTPTVYADSYDLVIIDDLTTVNDTETVITEPDITELEIVEDQTNTVDDLKYWYDVYVYLSSATGLGLTAILSRIAYLFIQTKRGKILVKNIQNTADALEDDIVENIGRLTELEDGEKLRTRLRAVQDQLLYIAQKKLPSKPPER